MNKKVFIWTHIEARLEHFISVENFPESIHVTLLEEEETFEPPRSRRDPREEILWYKNACDMMDKLVQRTIIKHSDAFGIVLPRDAVLASKMKRALKNCGVETPTYVPGINIMRDKTVVLFEF